MPRGILRGRLGDIQRGIPGGILRGRLRGRLRVMPSGVPGGRLRVMPGGRLGDSNRIPQGGSEEAQYEPKQGKQMTKIDKIVYVENAKRE